MKSARLLVVDDEPALRETLQEHLTELGFDVLTVASATSALNRIHDFDPEVVLTDVQMPGMTGLDLLDHLKELRTSIDIVVFTGEGDARGAIQAMQKGATDYLVKPLDLDEIERVIEQCLLKRRQLADLPPEDRDRLQDVPHGLVGRHPSMMAVFKSIGSVASADAPVMIRGETGTGKELVAKAIHSASPRSEHPFVAINCAAVSEDLLESELFGHMKGAFTGATADRRGKFEAAGEGTLFLDEIGDISAAFQAKLLRVLQEREFYPVGSDEPRRTSARIVAASHRSLARMVEEGRFREDLFYRLQVVEITLPPLRERRTDIPLLVRHLVHRAAAQAGKRPPVIPADVMESLVWREWPGNVRELQNVLVRAVVVSRGPALTPKDVGLQQVEGEGKDAPRETSPARALTLSDVRATVERDHIARILSDAEGNKSRAARVLKVSRPTLNRLIREHQLRVP